MMALGKPCVILAEERFDVDKFFSDLRGIDQIGYHKSEFELVEKLCHWLESNVGEIKEQLVPHQVLQVGQFVRDLAKKGYNYRFIHKSIILQLIRISNKKGEFTIKVENGKLIIGDH
jgi:hypothetical protein